MIKKVKNFFNQTMWLVLVSLIYAASQTDSFQSIQQFPEDKLKNIFRFSNLSSRWWDLSESYLLITGIFCFLHQ